MSGAPGERAGKWPRGEACYNAKLTAEKVRAVREAHDQGETIRAIADAHGLSYSAVWDLVEFRRWRHV